MAKITHDAELYEACRLLAAYTAYRIDPWILAGPAKASCRAHVMSALMGRRMPQSKSGVSALKDELHRRAGIEKTADSCSASRDREFYEIVREHFNGGICENFGGSILSSMR